MSALRDFAKKSRPASTVTEGPALWRGEIVEVLSNGLVWVMVPRMGGQDPIGPINSIPSGLVPGDRVVVGSIGGDVNDLIVMSCVKTPPVVPPSWGAITGKPSTFPPAAHTHTWASVTGKPSTFAPDAHRHTYADIDGVVPTSALPSMAIKDTFDAGSQAEMLALNAQRGDMCIRTDTFLTFVLAGDDPTQLVNWKQIMAAGQVTSVNGKTGVVQLATNDINGLSTALAAKADVIHTHDITAVTGTLPWAQMPVPVDLNGANLNGIVASGEYYQFGASPITEANGYPVGVSNASHVRVFRFGSTNKSVIQELTCWLNPQKWVRSTSNGGSTWQTWAKL